jgi:alanine-glyoxylate transaminase/serine-glyoxylate transaminase/serine-pyruvate transaminase
MSGRAVPRLKLLSSHLEPSSELNTPFLTERTSIVSTEINSLPPQARFFTSARRLSTETEKAARMSNQEPHPTLLIPGPIEFDDGVLNAMSHFR